MASSSNPPCAACKLLRRKCQPECVFTPYFPPDQPQKFANVHKVFGASNVTKLLNELQPHQREDAVNSLAGSTGYRSIQSFVDQFIEKNGNTIGDEVKLDQYGMNRLRAFIKLNFFQMVKESGLIHVMDDTTIGISDMLMHFEDPLLIYCIQEIQKGPIQKEAHLESEEEKLDQRKIKSMQEINLDGAKQGAAIVVSYVLSSSKSRVVLDVMMFALLMGIACSMLAHFLRKHKSVSKVLTKLGIMGTASSVILSFAALIPKVIISCTFGTIAILLLAFTLTKN